MAQLAARQIVALEVVRSKLTCVKIFLHSSDQSFGRHLDIISSLCGSCVLACHFAGPMQNQYVARSDKACMCTRHGD